jgi:Leucine-rich repeat (LRR) protein
MDGPEGLDGQLVQELVAAYPDVQELNLRANGESEGRRQATSARAQRSTFLVSSTGVTDAGLQHLAALSGSLTSLDLSQNELRSLGPGLATLTGLRELRLADNRM